MINPDNRAAIQSLQLQQMFSGSNVSLATSTLLAVILAFMQREAIAPTVILAWLSIVVLLTITRTVLVLHHQRSAKVSHSNSHSLLVNFRIGVVVSGLVWGSASFLMFPSNDPEHQMFLIFMLAGLTAGGVASYSADLVCAIGFSVSALVPLAIRLFAAGGSLSVAMGMAITLYLGFMILSGRKSNQHIRDNIVLRLEAISREGAIRTSEEHYRLLLRHSPAGLFHYNIDLVITYCNDRFADILKTTVDKVVGLDMKTLKDQSVLPTLRKALEGEIALYEGPYLATITDAHGWIAMSCAPSRDDNEKVVGGIAIVQDITERKQSEMIVIESEIRFRTIVEQSPIGIGLSREGITFDVNAVYLQMFGYDNIAEVRGRPLIEQIAPQCRAEIEDRVRRRMLGEQVEGAYETIGLRKDGSQFPLYITAKRVVLSDGPLTYAFLIDFTERKVTEEKIQHLAFYDHLTNLPNRRLLLDRLQQALVSSLRSSAHGALLFIDLDNFKTINDTLGHSLGDLLLQQVAQRLVSCVREGDTVARLGGDEFVVILEDLSEHSIEAAEQTDAVGEKILAAVSQTYQIATHELSINTSIGATLFSKDYQDVTFRH